MNNVLRFFLEFIGSFIVIGLLNFLVMLFMEKIFSPISAAIFTFVLSGLIIFLTAEYFIQSVNPAYIFLPILLILLAIDLYQANKKINRESK